MPNFLKISLRIKKFPIKRLDVDQSICMTAIAYSGMISAVRRNEQLL